MLKHLFHLSLILNLIFSSLSFAQTTRTLSGTIELDVAPNQKNREIEITVNNHSFVVLPSLTILRPITSSQARLVSLPAGQSSIDYFIDGIIDDPDNNDPVDYTIAIRCIGCSNDLPLQYYSPTGNRFGLANSTYIDPDDLPAVLDLTAITRATIRGDIKLDQTAQRDLTFTVTILSALNPQQVFATKRSITLPAGSMTTSYSVTGLRRSIGADQYRAQLKCDNCFGASRRAQIFERDLSPNANHSDINFSVTDQEPINLAPVLKLLLQ